MGFDFGNIGSAVGTVVGGVYGGPAGAAIGAQVGGAAGGAIGDAVDGDKKPNGVAAQAQGGQPEAWATAAGQAKPLNTTGPFGANQYISVPNSSGGRFIIDRCCCMCPNTRPGGLVAGEGSVETDRYIITPGEDRIEVYDKMTGTSFLVWGDPHLETSDGDKAQFHDNLAIDLPDGTTISIKTTPKDSNGISLIEAVAIMKGDEAVVMTGFNDGQPGVEIGSVLNNADAVAGRWTPSTVLRAGQQVDDLTFANGGEEIVGTDPSQEWGEHMLDGHGGVSVNHPNVQASSADAPGNADGTAAGDSTEGAEGAQSTSGPDESEFDKLPPNASLSQILLAIMADLRKALQNEATGLREKYYEKDGDGKMQLKDEFTEQDVSLAFDRIQRLNDKISELMTSVSNFTATEHDSKMTIANNLN